MFGLTGSQGNHGEDAKEYWFYLDNTPTHSYMKMLYKYPQAEFPYTQLIEESGRRGFQPRTGTGSLSRAAHALVSQYLELSEAVNPARQGTKTAAHYHSEIAADLSRRLIKLFLRNGRGQRPIYGDLRLFQDDPHWRDHILFNEYFHGDNGAGLGAAHQTGWTGLVAKLIQQSGGVRRNN